MIITPRASDDQIIKKKKQENSDVGKLQSLLLSPRKPNPSKNTLPPAPKKSIEIINNNNNDDNNSKDDEIKPQIDESTNKPPPPVLNRAQSTVPRNADSSHPPPLVKSMSELNDKLAERAKTEIFKRDTNVNVKQTSGVSPSNRNQIPTSRGGIKGGPGSLRLPPRGRPDNKFQSLRQCANDAETVQIRKNVHKVKQHPSLPTNIDLATRPRGNNNNPGQRGKRFPTDHPRGNARGRGRGGPPRGGGGGPPPQIPKNANPNSAFRRSNSQNTIQIPNKLPPIQQQQPNSNEELSLSQSQPIPTAKYQLPPSRLSSSSESIFDDFNTPDIPPLDESKTEDPNTDKDKNRYRSVSTLISSSNPQTATGRNRTMSVTGTEPPKPLPLPTFPKKASTSNNLSIKKPPVPQKLPSNTQITKPTSPLALPPKNPFASPTNKTNSVMIQDKPSRAPSKQNLSRCRTSIYHGLSQRQSIVLEEMDKEWSDAESTIFAAVVSGSEDTDDEMLTDRLSIATTSEETRKALESIDMDVNSDLSLFNLEEPGEYETSRKMSHGSIKPGVWEGWQRRVKRQTWEEWEERMTYNKGKKSGLGSRSNTTNHLSGMPVARQQQELDGRQVTPYWLIHWWLTKNTTDRPTVSKHPLLELILDNLHITDSLSSVTTGNDLNKLAYALVCIFDGCGKVMVLINHFVTQEIENTIHSNTLLRTNSITTKIISSYSKVAGVTFIRKLLSPLLQELVDENVAIEIDPKKLKDGKDVNEEIQKLLAVSQKFLDRITSTLDIVPYSFRQICNCLSVMICDKFTQETSFFGIGGFIFLRFICPSIVAPEAFGLLKKAPPSPVRRTLILISKIIQNLANGVKQSKEDYMNECTAIFISLNEQKIFDYYENLAKVPPLPADDPSVFALIPVPLVEEALTVIHRLVILHIDKIKEFLVDVDEVENVTYDVYENMSTVVLKSNIILESMRLQDQIEPSSPLFKPYSLFIDVILADGCKIVTTVITNLLQTADREIVAEALMVLVHQHGDSVHFIKSLISKDIQCAETIENALSGSSLSNLLFSGFLKVLTREFILKYWAPYFEQINNENACMELDPPRAPQNFDFMKANETLGNFGSKLLDLLVENEQHIHQQAREICAYAQLKLTQKFGSMVDPFYGAKLLCDRVFIPAVAYPKLFHILPEFPEFHARRSFVLGSMLVRNCIHYSVCDEGYMVGLNHVVLHSQPKVKTLLKCLSRPVDSNVETLQQSWQPQAEAVLVLHHFIDQNQDTLKSALQGVTNKESIIYNIFDRLAAVIALYRFRLRRRIASGVCIFLFFFQLLVINNIFF